MKRTPPWTPDQVALAEKLLKTKATDAEFRRLLFRSKKASRSYLQRHFAEQRRALRIAERVAKKIAKDKKPKRKMSMLRLLKCQSDEYKRPKPTMKEMRWRGWQPETPNQYWLGDPPLQRSALYTTGEAT